MLVATVELLLGTYRADPDGAAHTGQLEHGEWPPAPSRLFDALVAADGTRGRCRHTDGSELEFLENAGAPLIDAGLEVHHEPLLPRFVATWSHRFDQDPKSREVMAHQEYLGRRGSEVRPGVRLSPKSRMVRYLWDAEVSEAHLRSLRLRAARIGYLGCSDSPVRVRVEVTQDDVRPEEARLFAPDPGGAVPIGVPSPGRLAALDTAFDEWSADGRSRSVGRYQFPMLVTKVRYRPPRGAAGAWAAGCIVASLVLRPAVSGRHVSAVAEAFKAAVLDRYPAGRSELPAVLHGHGFEQTGYDLARFLALPDTGHAHASGRIHGVALWLPPDVDDAVVAVARDTVRSITELAGRGFRVRTETWNRQRRPDAARPRRWRGPSRRWATVFPAVHERHGSLSLEEIRRWCSHAGVPEPAEFRHSRTPLMAGAVSLVPSEVHRPGRPRRPYSHVELVFAEPVWGPIVIGSGRQRALGLCAPLDDGSTLPKPAAPS